MHSKIYEVGSFQLPDFNGDRLYMHHLDVQDPHLPSQVGRYQPLIDQLMPVLPLTKGIVYLTIDEKVLKPGTTHRRPGAHIDGIWMPALHAHQRPGHIMPARMAGAWDRPNRWNIDEELDGGGLLLLSDQIGCRAYTGDFNCIPGEGGDCEHIRDQLDAASSFTMEANKAYLCNVWGVHESLPVQEETQRSLLRITLPVEARL